MSSVRALCERLVAPRVPVDGVVRVLEEVRACLLGQPVHAHTLPMRAGFLILACALLSECARAARPRVRTPVDCLLGRAARNRDVRRVRSGAAWGRSRLRATAADSGRRATRSAVLRRRGMRTPGSRRHEAFLQLGRRPIWRTSSGTARLAEFSFPTRVAYARATRTGQLRRAGTEASRWQRIDPAAGLLNRSAMLSFATPSDAFSTRTERAQTSGGLHWRLAPSGQAVGRAGGLFGSGYPRGMSMLA